MPYHPQTDGLVQSHIEENRRGKRLGKVVTEFTFCIIEKYRKHQQVLMGNRPLDILKKSREKQRRKVMSFVSSGVVVEDERRM